MVRLQMMILCSATQVSLAHLLHSTLTFIPHTLGQPTLSVGNCGIYSLRMSRFTSKEVLKTDVRNIYLMSMLWMCPVFPSGLRRMEARISVQPPSLNRHLHTSGGMTRMPNTFTVQALYDPRLKPGE